MNASLPKILFGGLGSVALLVLGGSFPGFLLVNQAIKDRFGLWVGTWTLFTSLVFLLFLWFLPLGLVDSELIFLTLALSMGLVAANAPWPKNWNGRKLYRVLAGSTVASLLLIPIWMYLTSNPAFMEGLKASFLGVWELTFSTSTEVTNELGDAQFKSLLGVLSSAFAAAVFVLFAAVFWLSARLQPLTKRPFLKIFFLPSKAIYAFLLALGNLLWSLRRPPDLPLVWWEAAVQNVATVVIILFFFQGMGIVYARLERLSSGAILKPIFSFGLLTFMYLLPQYVSLVIILVAAFGATETWVKWRVFPEAQQRREL